MPQINLKQPGQPVADFSVSGCSITVAGITVDCASRQLDTAVVVEVRTGESGAIEGGAGAYLAQIEIPARIYMDVEIVGADGEPSVAQEPVAIDPNAIAVTLWPTA